MATKHTTKQLWRRRVMAAIGGYLRLVGQPENTHVIIGTALKALGGKYKYFDDVPQCRLQNLYNTFVNAQKDYIASQDIRQVLEGLAGINPNNLNIIAQA